MIDVECDGCGRTYAVDDGLAGRTLTCKRCGTRSEIPGPGHEVSTFVPAPVPEVVPERTPGPVRARRKKQRAPGSVDRAGWIALGVGLAMAIGVLFVGPLQMVLLTLTVVIHELGHSVAAWTFGIPMVPRFDLTYGGGYSVPLTGRIPLLNLLVCVALGYQAFRDRDDRRRLVGLLAILAAYTVAVLTPLHTLLIAAMGHGTELIFAGIFLHRALGNHQILRSEERPLYACLGFFLVLHNIRFAWSLMRSAEFREMYGDAKGGGHTMDLDVIALEYLHVRLEAVATLFLVLCLLTPVVVWLNHRYRHRLA